MHAQRADDLVEIPAQPMLVLLVEDRTGVDEHPDRARIKRNAQRVRARHRRPELGGVGEHGADPRRQAPRLPFQLGCVGALGQLAPELRHPVLERRDLHGRAVRVAGARRDERLDTKDHDLQSLLPAGPPATQQADRALVLLKTRAVIVPAGRQLQLEAVRRIGVVDGRLARGGWLGGRALRGRHAEDRHQVQKRGTPA